MKNKIDTNCAQICRILSRCIAFVYRVWCFRMHKEFDVMKDQYQKQLITIEEAFLEEVSPAWKMLALERQHVSYSFLSGLLQLCARRTEL